MMASVQKKSLTTPPTNLKEAIDWVLKIKNDNNAIDKLAEALEELLKHDGSEVALKVLEKYRLVSKSVIEKLKPQKSERHFAVPHVILNKLSEGLDPFPSGSQANIRPEDVVKVKEWVSSVDGNTLKQLIETFAGGLESFRKNILQNPKNSAYQSDADWNNLTTSDKRDCAAILLGIMPVVYIGLTYLYWQCEGTDGWSKQSLTDSGSSSSQDSLKNFMVKLGFEAGKLNQSKKGSDIATHLKSNCFNELTSRTNVSSNSYPEFLGKLQETALTSRSPSPSHPLTSLYALSYYYITNFLYIVEPTSPATPSFLGYSGTAALAGGAYGFNLGGSGTFMSALLA
ncbi:variant erythrocyte surface antigen-1 family protein [Babesia caballi]|uniref:Variant erythrocyte surface antigen-1 family protein n=1 Tax=Babesia caballi TaxID=5871 RepID=A0AAV4LZ79_BABCB|nr:variant erythrocyte surface antigen-1 family protein [Babesia caballi]